MSYQIVRTKKLKSAGNVKASLEHMFRERYTPNADPTRRHLNIDSGNVSSAMHKFKQLTPRRVRKDSVQALEYLVTASPEWFESSNEQTTKRFLDEGFKWIIDRHQESHVVAWSYQYDETSPHLSVIVRPIARNKRGETTLACKRWTGSRDLLAKMQDSFHSLVGAAFGLNRGNRRSKRKHIPVQAYHGATLAAEKENAERLRHAQESKKRLELEMQTLKESEKRWRKKAQEIAKNWFTSDIEKSEDPNILDQVLEEVNRSDVIPRGVKRLLNKEIYDRKATLNSNSAHRR